MEAFTTKNTATELLENLSEKSPAPMSAWKTRDFGNVRSPIPSTPRAVDLEVKTDIDIRGGSRESTSGFPERSTFEENPGLMARAARGKKRDIINSVAGYNEVASKWVTLCDNMHYLVETTLETGQKLPNTVAGLEKACEQYAVLATARRMVQQGFAVLQRGINTLMKQNPQLAAQLRSVLKSVMDNQAKVLQKFDGPMKKLNHFFIANQSKMPKLTQSGQAMAQIGKVLAAAGLVNTAIDAAANSPAQTTVGKIVNGALEGFMGFLLGEASGGLSFFDGLTGSNVAGILNTAVATFVATGEAAITGNMEALRLVEEKSRKGDYGLVIRDANKLGNTISGLIDTAGDVIGFAMQNRRTLEGIMTAAQKGDSTTAGNLSANLGYSIAERYFQK